MCRSCFRVAARWQRSACFGLQIEIGGLVEKEGSQVNCRAGVEQRKKPLEVEVDLVSGGGKMQVAKLQLGKTLLAQFGMDQVYRAEPCILPTTTWARLCWVLPKVPR